MKLETYFDGNAASQIVAENPDDSIIETTLKQMDWSSIAFVTLVSNSNNSCEASGSLVDGFCVKLTEDGVEYVSESEFESPEAMMPALIAYLKGDLDLVFRIVLDVERRNLSEEDIEYIKRSELDDQGGRQAREAVAEAAALFRDKRYGDYVRKVTPFEVFLSDVERKKLSLARKKHSLSN